MFWHFIQPNPSRQSCYVKVHVLGISKTRLLSNNKTRLLGSSKTRLLGNSKIHPQGSCKAHLPICKVHLSSYKVAFLFIRLGYKLKWTIKVFLSVDINVFCQFKNLSLLIKAIKCFLMYLLLLQLPKSRPDCDARSQVDALQINLVLLCISRQCR